MSKEYDRSLYENSYNFRAVFRVLPTYIDIDRYRYICIIFLRTVDKRFVGVIFRTLGAKTLNMDK